MQLFNYIDLIKECLEADAKHGMSQADIDVVRSEVNSIITLLDSIKPTK